MRNCRRFGCAFLLLALSVPRTELRSQTTDPSDAACISGDLNVCADLGARYYEGYRLSVDYSKAVRFLAMACDVQQPGASCAWLGDAYMNGIAVARNSTRGMQLLRGTCAARLANGCRLLGIDLLSLHSRNDSVAAFAALTQACALQNADGCRLATAAFPRESTDWLALARKAVVLAQAACDAGELSSCEVLHVAYSYGLGVAADVPRGLRALLKACDGGYYPACATAVFDYHYASMDSVVKDFHRVSMAERACDHNIAFGCESLAELYRNGDFVTRDDARSVALLRRACDNFNASSCYELGSAFGEGKGVGQNADSAFVFIARACDVQGDGYYCKKAAALRSTRTGPVSPKPAIPDE